jgi:hypothetical protein
MSIASRHDILLDSDMKDLATATQNDSHFISALTIVGFETLAGANTVTELVIVACVVSCAGMIYGIVRSIRIERSHNVIMTGGRFRHREERSWIWTIALKSYSRLTGWPRIEIGSRSVRKLRP